MRNWCFDANATEMSAFSLYCRCFRGDHFVIISMIIVSWKRLGKPKTRLAVRKPLRSHKNTSAASSGNQSFEKHWVIYDLWCWGIVGKWVRGTHFYLEWGIQRRGNHKILEDIYQPHRYLLQRNFYAGECVWAQQGVSVQCDFWLHYQMPDCDGQSCGA